MKTVFIGNDKSILTGENGDARERQIEYAKYFDSLTIIIFSLKKDNLKEQIIGNLKLIPTNSNNRWLYFIDSLIIISHAKIDLISTQDPFVAGLVGVLAKLLFGIKLNIQIHNDFFGSRYFRRENLQNYIFYWLGKCNLLFADSIRVVSPRQKIGRNCFVAPVATDIDYFWSKPHIKKFNQIVCVARLAKQKNLPLLFDAAKSFPDLKFVIVGEGEERKNLEKIRPTNVVLVGQKNRGEVKKIYNQSDIFVLPSNYEGWGITVVEALASGLPAIMTDTGCAQSLIISNKIGGLVVPIGNKKKLVSGVKKLLDNQKKSEKFVLGGQKLLKREYNKNQLVEKFVFSLKNTV